MNKVSPQDLMDYLYDELSAERRAEVEAQLQQDPQARAELEALGGVRQSLGALPDEPVDRPVLMIAPEPGSARVRRWPRAVAAVILLLVLSALALRLQVQVGQGTLTVAFGTPRVDTVRVQEGLTARAVSAMMEEKLAARPVPKGQNADSLRRALETWKGQLMRQVVALQMEQARQGEEVPEAGGITQEEFYTTLRELQEENVRLMMALVEDSNVKMQEEVQQTLYQFGQYYEWQRSQDQSQWEARLSHLQQETEVTQRKTDLIYDALAAAKD